MQRTKDPKTGAILDDGMYYAIGEYGTGFGVPQNRMDAAIAVTRRTMTFPDGQGPTQVVARLEASAGENAFIVVTASGDQHADNELADPASQDSTTERYTVFETALQPQGIPIASITPIKRIDYLMPVVAGAAVLYIEGA